MRGRVTGQTLASSPLREKRVDVTSHPGRAWAQARGKLERGAGWRGAHRKLGDGMAMGIEEAGLVSIARCGEDAEAAELRDAPRRGAIAAAGRLSVGHSGPGASPPPPPPAPPPPSRSASVKGDTGSRALFAAAESGRAPDVANPTTVARASPVRAPPMAAQRPRAVLASGRGGRRRRKAGRGRWKARGEMLPLFLKNASPGLFWGKRRKPGPGGPFFQKMAPRRSEAREARRAAGRAAQVLPIGS